ncbi:uncharacterized protein LOC112528416 [Cynara cardunculus var. scolymus]|uniref:Armadillo n=1 Tax=Cynara cardunculus var. scolymus TaxID=59895 RepID=A0A103XRI4_CYNCS|nr:uncharacterized protein LOC112528416 [Cynara cardunculus var. scolymus]KVH95552.1 Armadillo [Cynara cardunculus var. scolymus]
MDRHIFQFNQVDDHHQQPPIEEVLSFPIVLSDRILHAVDDSKSYKLECADVGKQVDRLSQMLRSAVRLANSTPSFYERPVRRIFTDVAKTLNRALNLVRKCRRGGFFRRFVSIVGVVDFRKLFNLLDASIGDVKWLLSIFDVDGESGGIAGGGGIVLSLPPIASNDPILSWVWSYIASLHFCSINVKIEAAHELSSLSRDNDRNKKIIIEEGGISPLLKLLKEKSSPEAQIAAAMALCNLANDQNNTRVIVNEHGIPNIVQIFRNSPILVQIEVAKLIARMAEHDSVSQEGFARENVIGSLVSFLSFNMFIDDDGLRGKTNKFLKKVIHPNVEINTQVDRSLIMCSDNSNKRGKKEPQDLILEFKTNCSGALWMLARGSIANSRKITETKGLLYLAKLIEKENGELQINCLMTIIEITAAAEYNPDLRRSAFKTNSPSAKAIVDQLLRLIHESDNPVTKIPAIKAIGHLARTFPSRETRVIGPLVKQLSHKNPIVGTESVIALCKFTCEENFLHAEHSKTIVEFKGLPPLMNLLRGNERTQYHALVLLCYLAMHAGINESFEQRRLLTALEGADNSVACRHSELRELVAKAVQYLKILS